MRDAMTTDIESTNNIHALFEEELDGIELESIAGGRITNVRANASGLGGGGMAGTTQLLASIG